MSSNAVIVRFGKSPSRKKFNDGAFLQRLFGKPAAKTGTQKEFVVPPDGERKVRYDFVLDLSEKGLGKAFGREATYSFSLTIYSVFHRPDPKYLLFSEECRQLLDISPHWQQRWEYYRKESHPPNVDPLHPYRLFMSLQMTLPTQPLPLPLPT